MTAEGVPLSFERSPLPSRRFLAFGRTLRGALGAALAAIAVLLLSPPARATLAQDVETLSKAWARDGQVRALRPRLVGRGERLPIPLPSWSSVPGPRGCTNLVILTSPSVSFSLQLGGANEREPEPSRVGWAQIVRGGRSRMELRRIWLEMRSPRGVVEVLVARSDKPLPTPGALLAHRDPGPESALGQAGPAPMSTPVEARALAWEAQAKSDGALRIERTLVRASARRRPVLEVDLRAGCHRYSVLALQTESREAAPDLDLVLRVMPEDIVLGDQSENSDAELELCVGATSRLEVLVPGLNPGDTSVLEHGEFPLPAGLPQQFGPEVGARFAAAFFRRRQPGPASLPLVQALGIGGRTILPYELERRTCYVAGVAVVQGKPKSLMLDATIADREGATDGTGDDPSLALAFCTGDEPWVELRVEVTGSNVTWLAAVWRTGPAEAGEDMP